MVKVEGLEKKFREEIILTDVNMSMEQGKIYGLVGSERQRKNCADEVYLWVFAAHEGVCYGGRKGDRKGHRFSAESWSDDRDTGFYSLYVGKK